MRIYLECRSEPGSRHCPTTLLLLQGGAADGEGAAEGADRAHREGRLHMQLPSNRSSLCGAGQPDCEPGKKKKGEQRLFLTWVTFPITTRNKPSRPAGLSSQTRGMKAGRCEHGQPSPRLCQQWDCTGRRTEREVGSVTLQPHGTKDSGWQTR